MKPVKVNRCGIVILAAGKSSRLGSPKQLLRFEGKTLLQNSMESALATGLRPVILVLGSGHEMLAKDMGNDSIRNVVNEEWEEGMASSIRCGVREALKTDPDLDGLIIMVCDQPFADKDLLVKLLKSQQETGMPMVASIYGENPGVPALFHKSRFEDLLALRGDTGARKLLKEKKDETARVNFPAGITDIDTLEDYSALKSQNRRETK